MTHLKKEKMPHIVIKLKDGAINVTFSIVYKRDLSAGCITEKNIL